MVQHDTDLWSAEHEFGWQAGFIPIPVRMTVIRLSDGQLILHSPIPIEGRQREVIGALGRVGFIVVPNAHGQFAEQVAQIYPDAELLAAPSPPRSCRSLPFTRSLADEPPGAWVGQVESLLLQGFRLKEVVLLHRPSRSLIVPDLGFNVQRTPYRRARAFFKLNGMWQHFGPSRLIRNLAVSNRAAFQDSLDQVLAWDFERVLPGHGDVIDHGGPAALRAAWPK